MTEKVFLDYDQAGLDRQLNLRARWPEHTEHLARWARASAEVRQTIGGALDLAYGPGPGERLDLFVPEDRPPPDRPPPDRPPPDRPPPVIAFIHGGYWQGLDKSDFSYLAPSYLASGIAYASLNYDLTPQVSIEEIVRQVRAALGWLFRNGADHGVDPARIYVAGHSAGGHLAAMALATDWTGGAFGEDLPADLIKGACSVSGVYDLEAIRLSYHQKVVKLDPDMARRMSPLGNVPTTASHLILALGSEETEEFHRQQAAFLAEWRAAGLPAAVVDLPGRNHFTAIDAFGETDNPLFAATRSLVLEQI